MEGYSSFLQISEKNYLSSCSLIRKCADQRPARPFSPMPRDMKTSKKTRKAIRKSVRKAVKRHSIATGFVTGVATAMALSASGLPKILSEATGTGLANLMRFRKGMNGGLFNGLKTATTDALNRAGHYFQSEPEQEIAHERPVTRRTSGTRSRA
jgi:hypothetical protein